MACFVLLLVFVSGCGGGDQGSESQNGGNDGAAQNEGGTSPASGGETAQESGGATAQGGEATAGQAADSAPEIKIALGEIITVDTERRRLVLRPVEGERQVFRVVPNANVTLDDRPAEIDALEQGQSAQIQYIVANGRERARAVDAFSASGAAE